MDRDPGREFGRCKGRGLHAARLAAGMYAAVLQPLHRHHSTRSARSGRLARVKFEYDAVERRLIAPPPTPTMPALTVGSPRRRGSFRSNRSSSR